MAIFQNQIKIWLKIGGSQLQGMQLKQTYIKIISNQKSKDALNRMKMKEQRKASARRINECGQELVGAIY